ncbi:MAG TPA: hypothetical protein VGT24_03295 [Candidatus Acidoferrales bacterium]|nr:hypothetical protein [Candidatus Acidoferrales bacterium]
MRRHRRYRALRGIAFVAILALCGNGRAQQAPPESEVPLPPAFQQVQTVQNPAGPCIEPPPPVSWQDYNGPFSKILGIFGQKIERRTVLRPQAPRYQPNAVLCSLETKEKFFLFLHDSVDPVTFLAAGFNAGISQATNGDAPFGQGAAGYGKRYGASYADEVQLRFFKGFVYPALFSEDPRYYREGQGPAGKRILHALEHSVVAYRDNGNRMFNFSELLGNATGVSLGNLYHPGARRGFGPGAEQVALDYALDSGYDVVREFWPEVSRKFHLPFRYQNEVTNPGNK